jgi:hypothetical protein
MSQIKMDNEFKSVYEKSNARVIFLDGIINEQFYKKTFPKILWILKEPYDLGDNDKEWNYRNDVNISSEIYLKYKTWRNIAKVSSGIINNLTYEEVKFDVDKLKESIQKIALINTSKIPAGTTSDHRWGHFEKIYNITKELLKKQIEFINADIIIGGNILYLYKDDFGLNENNFEVTEWGRCCYNVNGKLFIDAYHPGCRYSEENYFNDIVSYINKRKNSKK